MRGVLTIVGKNERGTKFELTLQVDESEVLLKVANTPGAETYSFNPDLSLDKTDNSD